MYPTQISFPALDSDQSVRDRATGLCQETAEKKSGRAPDLQQRVRLSGETASEGAVDGCRKRLCLTKSTFLFVEFDLMIC
ncbi:MAG: hypothetical protein CMJ81_08320 [Planctomycetaceae bacterium]|nr:hypothetical protein [Planctomycetaceae bacterium]MBP61329.1 hypothetical protein [Planctomycetaceae bacterium]